MCTKIGVKTNKTQQIDRECAKIMQHVAYFLNVKLRISSMIHLNDQKYLIKTLQFKPTSTRTNAY